MDPALPSLSAVNALTQALLVRQGVPPAEVEALLKAVGQELAVRYLGMVAEGARLEFPGGRIITATGEVPFPEGTQLRVRITDENGALKLQTLEAKPPAPSALLVPLMQGEAAPLLAQLQQTTPPDDLNPLVQILRTLMEESAQELPSLPVLEKAIAALPKELALQLSKALGAEVGESPQALARRILAKADVPQTSDAVLSAKDPLLRLQSLLNQASIPQEVRGELEAWIRSLTSEKPREVGRELPLSVLTKAIAALPKDLAAQLAKALGAEVGEPPEALARRILAGAKEPGVSEGVLGSRNPLARLQSLLSQASIPAEARSQLDAWLRSLQGRRLPEVARELASTPGNRILSHGDLTKVASALRVAAVVPSQVSEVWEAWVKGSVRTLADPELSPREAPFHALQGRENTGFFEIPMPWASGKAMQLWVEKDAPESQGLDPEPVTRMLLGLSLTRLGEIRIGLQRCGEALSVRIWAEHSELIEGQKLGIDQELHAIASTVDLRILPLEVGTNGSIPDIRSVVIGPSLHALG